VVMSRKPRLVIPGYPHHITQRGNHQKRVFFTNDDHRFYLELLQRQIESKELSLLGYTFMTNHVHHEPIPRADDSLSRYMRTLDRDFSRFQNLRRNQTGHLWQARFFSCPVYDMWEVLAYIELNPVRAYMVTNPAEWEWSSARAHLTGEDHSGLLNMDLWRQHFDPRSWKKYLDQAALRTDINDRIRKATTAGRFCGPENIAKEMERKFRKPIKGKLKI
jgi:putative transposase